MSTAAKSPPLPASNYFDLVVIGSGPAALAVVARILESRPAALYTEDEHQHLHWLRRVDTSHRPLLQTRRTGRGQEKAILKQRSRNDACECEGEMRILVIDKLGAWLANWDRLFAAYQIPHLRSPLFFHPAPADIEALLAYSHRTGRTVTQLAGDEQSSGTFSNRRRSRCTKHEAACKSGICADLVEIPGCVGKEVSKHKHKKNRSRRSLCGQKALAEISMGPAVNERDRKDYFTPSTELFRDFIEHDIIQRYKLDNCGKTWPCVEELFEQSSLNNASQNESSDTAIDTKPVTMAKGEVKHMDYGILHIDGWDRMEGFCLQLNNDIKIGAKAAVCAIGPGAIPAIPEYLQAKRKRVAQHGQMPFGPGWCHSTTIGVNGDIFPPRALLAKEKQGQSTTLAVIGGGLTSAQICDVAIRSGVSRVVLIMRGYMKVKPFDVGLEWVGRYANLEKMRFWQEDDPQKRLEALRAARNGGSITPSYAKLVRTYAEHGKLQLRTCCTVKDATWTRDTSASDVNSGCWHIEVETASAGQGKRCNGHGAACASANTQEDGAQETIKADYLVSATGAAPTFSKVPFLSGIAAQEDVPEYGGLPWISESLQYGNLPLFCTGAFSALQIGPGAFNLEGMRAAADRIAVRLQELAIGKPLETAVEGGTTETDATDVPTPSSHLVADEALHYTHFSFNQLPTEVET